MSQIFSSEYFTDIVLALGGILIVNLIVRVIQYLISSKVKEKNLRYGLRSATSFFGYFLIFILLIGIFSNQLSKLAVVFGVAGAGIALAAGCAAGTRRGGRPGAALPAMEGRRRGIGRDRHRRPSG